MQVVRLGSHLRPPFDPSNFEGEVAIQPLVTEKDAALSRVILVRFRAGARNKWHTHTFDQVLLATAGVGIIADEQEEHTLVTGDLIVVPAGVVHWHGATADSDFAHLNIGTPGETTIVRPHDRESALSVDQVPETRFVARGSVGCARAPMDVDEIRR